RGTHLHQCGTASREEFNDIECGSSFSFLCRHWIGGSTTPSLRIGETRAKKLGITMITGKPPVGTHSGMPVEVDQPRHDEALRGLKRVVYRPIIGLTHKGNAVILPNYHTILDKYVGVPVKTDYSATLELRAHSVPLFTGQHDSCYHGDVRQAILE